LRKIENRYLYFSLSGILFFLGSFHLQNYIQQHTNILQRVEGKKINAKGKIIDINDFDHPRFKKLITFTTQSAHDGENKSYGQLVGKNILIYTSKNGDFHVDDEILLNNIKLKKPKTKSIALYLQKENAIGTLVYDLANVELMHRPILSIERWIHSKKTTIFGSLKNKMNRATFTFFSSLFLGNRKINKYENEKLKESCKYWGISHYLARSGLHLVVFIMVWEFLLRFIPIAFIVKQLLLILLTIIYFLLSWNSISFFRAFLTFICYKTLLLTNVPSHTLHTIIFVCWLILLWNPFQLLFLDFQLSFGVTFLLAWINQYRSHTKILITQNS
jgi:competence protein ComEC